MTIGDKVCHNCDYIRLSTNYNYCPKCGTKLMLRKDHEEYMIQIENELTKYGFSS